MTMRNSKRDKTEFNWHCDKLYLERKFTGVALVADVKYPGLWRVRYKDTVSDMVNRTRAKDAAYSIFRSL